MPGTTTMGRLSENDNPAVYSSLDLAILLWKGWTSPKFKTSRTVGRARPKFKISKTVNTKFTENQSKNGGQAIQQELTALHPKKSFSSNTHKTEF